MFELGGSFGWDSYYKDNPEKQTQFMKSLVIPTHRNKTCFQFVDVFETLALLYVVNMEMQKFIDKASKEAQDEQALRNKIQLDLQKVENAGNTLALTVAKKKVKIRQSRFYMRDNSTDLQGGGDSNSNFNLISSFGKLVKQLKVEREKSNKEDPSRLMAKSFVMENEILEN